MKTNIKIISPAISGCEREFKDIEPMTRPDLKFTHTMLDIGSSSIESTFDESLSVPDTIVKAIEAEREGANAIIIDCMGDPGLKACREAVSIPVIGPAETAMHMASMLGHKFSFITVLSALNLMVDNLVAGYNLKESYASFRCIDIPVLELHGNMEAVVQGLTEQSIKAVREDGAGAIVLGCTCFLGCAAAIKEGLMGEGLDIPVIDPIPLAVATADALVKTGLTHSKSVYPTPRNKPVAGFTIPDFR